jgi:mannose-6-phosphate isomerase-like protein (cupin superfamily)
MGFVENVAYGPMVGDPDDHRPNTEWAFVFDPLRDSGPSVDDITCLFERIAPGDTIPLHTHTTSEVVVVDEGTGSYRLGDETTTVRNGSVIFIPAGVPHGTVNDGTETLRIHAMYPSRVLDFTYLERNPAPGTEGDPPRPPTRLDPRVDSL